MQVQILRGISESTPIPSLHGPDTSVMAFMEEYDTVY